MCEHKMLEWLAQLEADLVKKDELLRETKEQNQKQAELINALREDKKNQCKDMFCFDCLDNLKPSEIRVSERLRERARKETPKEMELVSANRNIQEQA